MTTKLYDNFNRLTAIDNVPSGWEYTLSYAYDYNTVNQRTGIIDEDNFTWAYSYDLLGQLKRAACTWDNQTALVYDYNFDGIGNRTQTTEGFENPDTWTYTSNSLNQYTSRTHDNETDNFTYDLDGNLTQDDHWTYTWDAENRLTKLESRQTRSSQPLRILLFGYDDQSRRVSKAVLDLNDDNATYTTSLFRRFVYDGWNLIAELNEYGHPVSTYVWGSDLSGSFQGAGGIGGLLMAKHWHVGDNATTFPAYDGNGNVRGLFRSDNGTLETYCAYDPFGQTFIANDRDSVPPNPFGFSTKYYDNETEMYYYGYRYMKNGRWISRDPMEEEGGYNLYVYVDNNPISFIDPFGNLTNFGVFRAMGWHWFWGGGSLFKRHGGEWGEFIKNYYGWKNDANNNMTTEAQRLWDIHSSDSEGSYVIAPHLMFINESIWTKVVLNGVQYGTSGKYEVKKCERKVILSKISHLVTDWADADGKKDTIIFAAQILGYPFDLYQPYPVELSWDTGEALFKFNINGKMTSRSGDWPFN